MKKLALFDFDGTITSSDTLFEIARFSSGTWTYTLKIFLLIPSFVSIKLGIISKQRGKEIFLKKFFAQKSIAEFNEICENFCIQRLPAILRPKALEEINSHLSNGTETYIVSASPENWIEPWASPLGIKVIGTVLETQDGRITGAIAGDNCNGKEKVARINKELNTNDFDEIMAYGDTKGDWPMLDLAQQKNYKPFR